jgi:hypothetical protein
MPKLKLILLEENQTMAYDEYMNKMAAMGALPTEPAIRSGSQTPNNESAAIDRAQKTYMDAMQNLMMQEQSGQMQNSNVGMMQSALPQPQPATNLTDFFINLGTKLGGR